MASAALLINVQDTLNSSIAYPMTALAITPDLVGITLATTITCVSAASQTDQQTAVRLATQAASDYINNLGSAIRSFQRHFGSDSECLPGVQNVRSAVHRADKLYSKRIRPPKKRAETYDSIQKTQ